MKDVVTTGRIGRCPFWSLKVPLSRVLDHRLTVLRLTGGSLSDVYKSEWMMVSESPNWNRTFASFLCAMLSISRQQAKRLLKNDL